MRWFQLRLSRTLALPETWGLTDRFNVSFLVKPYPVPKFKLVVVLFMSVALLFSFVACSRFQLNPVVKVTLSFTAKPIEDDKNRL